MKLSFSISAKFKEWILKLSFSFDRSETSKEMEE